MTEPTDIDALIADNRKWVQLHRENKYQREAAKRMTGVLDALELTLAELRQERERADEASHAAGRHKSDAALFEADLSRAEETIARALSALDPSTGDGAALDEARAILTEYSKQKGESDD